MTGTSAPMLAVTRTPNGVQIASNLTDVRLQALLLSEALEAIVRKALELHPPEQAQILAPLNGGVLSR